jgi:hypothetical protein
MQAPLTTRDLAGRESKSLEFPSQIVDTRDHEMGIAPFCQRPLRVTAG